MSEGQMDTVDETSVSAGLPQTAQAGTAGSVDGGPGQSTGGEGAAPLTDLQRVSALSRQGYQLLKDSRLDDSMQIFLQILEIDPKNNYALVGLGDAARKKGLFHDAAEYYERCLKYHPGNNYALFGLADCYKALNRFTKAIEIWEQYLRFDNKNITVLTRVADAYRKLREFRPSKELYLRVLEREENNPYAIIGLGHLHYDFKEYRDALFYWGKMLERYSMSTVDIRVLTSIGNCHRKLKAFAEGLPYFEEALRREPANFYALFGLADCYRGLAQPNRSLEYWNQILEQDPRNKVILTRAGDAYCNLGNYDKAVEYYRRALNIEFDLYAVLGLAIVAKHQGRLQEAIDSLHGLILQEPRNYRPYLELSDCYLLKRDKNAALEVLRSFQRVGVRNTFISARIEEISNPL